MRATRLLRVVPDYQGTWQGDWSVTGCGDEGDWTGVCQEVPNGTVWALTLGITQTRDSVTGTTDPYGDDLPGPVSGTIRQSGHLVVSGTYTITIKGNPGEITVSNWETITTDNERMTGRFRVTTRAAGLQGSVYHDGELRNVTKTSATPLMAVAEASVGLRKDLLLTRGRQSGLNPGLIAGCERARIAEWEEEAGLARVRATGGRLGRPRATVADSDVERTAHLSVRAAAARLGVSRSVVQRARTAGRGVFVA